jgi:hypothetical protein
MPLVNLSKWKREKKRPPGIANLPIGTGAGIANLLIGAVVVLCGFMRSV